MFITRTPTERKLHQGLNVNLKWSEILIQISVLILIQIRMCTGSLPWRRQSFRHKFGKNWPVCSCL